MTAPRLALLAARARAEVFASERASPLELRLLAALGSADEVAKAEASFDLKQRQGFTISEPKQLAPRRLAEIEDLVIRALEGVSGDVEAGRSGAVALLCLALEETLKIARRLRARTTQGAANVA